MILRTMRQLLVAFLFLFLFLPLFLPGAVMAQTPASSTPTSGDQLFKPEQLDALVAPIALYPDTLLAMVLMASTYPLEVVQASRWASENKNLKDDALKTAVDTQGWDDSVKGLVATPDVLKMMSDKLDWTQKLGDAVLAQQPDVMDAIQRLRARAQANNKLQTTPQQTVTVNQEGGRQMIAIAQTDPNTVYVPYYDPNVVYGGWPYSDYPPYYWGYPGYIGAGIIAAGIGFGAGYLVGRWARGNYVWGGGVNWGNRNIIANRPRVNPLGGNNWQHNAAHRQGVRYTNASVAQRFGNNNLRGGAQQRMDFRGRGGQRVLNPGGGNRPGGGGEGVNRPGGGGAGAANRPAQRPSAANRPAQRPANRAGGGARRDTAFGNRSPGQVANRQSARGHASFGGARASIGGGGGMRVGGGGGFRGGGGGGGGRGGGGRRSDIALKHDVVLLGHLDNGLGFYRFSYNGSDKPYVGVIAQEVQSVMPQAVARGRDGYLRVFYDRLGVRFETYDRWVASGALVPAGAPVH
jgi:Protein of unknown function (DUF3300)